MTPKALSRECKHEWQLDDLGKHCKKCNHKDHVPLTKENK